MSKNTPNRVDCVRGRRWQARGTPGGKPAETTVAKLGRQLRLTFVEVWRLQRRQG